ncbi:glycosyl transferase family protein [Sphingomonas sp. BN140010]|uniref:Glycosyl transferase family protein n=1 Tax=Sphingomonas arvum TaxID=2992113 RepID=A0ABT3JFK4_9SPHN|nr:glycosyl transferase family protein [Sphingomonas sp. BN140010]MCW3797858.1 glycosyl transferase family protein [Sphingomonas sp. BN140010]
MSLAWLVQQAAAELSLFAAAGFLFFALDDLALDLIFFIRRAWRAMTVYRRHPRADSRLLADDVGAGWMVVFIPAWDEAAVIAQMLRATLERFDYPNYALMVGHYRNDPATAAAIRSVGDPRVVAVDIGVDGPSTKADCLNRLYTALVRLETEQGRRAKAVVLHDAEDLVHPQELRLFNRLIGRAGVVQLPVVPLIDPASPWIGGHYCDEFAESHGRDLVVREAVGASIPLAGVGCAIGREAMGRLAVMEDGRPFAGSSMTEDYEMGLRLGALGERTVFVRLPVLHGEGGVVASRGHFPATLSAAVRQKARWLGGIAFSGWDRLGWAGHWGERWFRMRDRRGPLAALLLLAGYLGALLWSQLWLAEQLGAPAMPVPPGLALLLKVTAALLVWRVVLRAAFTASAYGWGEGLMSLPRMFVGNLVAILAARRALAIHLSGGPKTWDKTDHMFPADAAR